MLMRVVCAFSNILDIIHVLLEGLFQEHQRHHAEGVGEQAGDQRGRERAGIIFQ